MIIGIDEVGRGPIAGPVCVCAFLYKGKASTLRLRINQEKVKKNLKKPKLQFADSKKLSKADREAWLVIVRKWRIAGICDFAVTFVHAEAIDRIGIVPSIKLALARSLGKLGKGVGPKKQNAKHAMLLKHTILLDGGLRAPAQYKKQHTIIKGDEKEPVIGLASIVAKVHRDRYMSRLAKKHPAYGFDSHVGYGTRAHYQAIKKHGTIPLHRLSFLTKILD